MSEILYRRTSGLSLRKKKKEYDDNTMETVQLYIANILSAKEAVERLRYSKVNNQVSFHTEKALQYLKPGRRSSYARKDI